MSHSEIMEQAAVRVVARHDDLLGQIARDLKAFVDKELAAEYTDPWTILRLGGDEYCQKRGKLMAEIATGFRPEMDVDKVVTQEVMEELKKKADKLEAAGSIARKAGRDEHLASWETNILIKLPEIMADVQGVYEGIVRGVAGSRELNPELHVQAHQNIKFLKDARKEIGEAGKIVAAHGEEAIERTARDLKELRKRSDRITRGLGHIAEAEQFAEENNPRYRNRVKPQLPKDLKALNKAFKVLSDDDVHHDSSGSHRSR